MKKRKTPRVFSGPRKSPTQDILLSEADGEVAASADGMVMVPVSKVGGAVEIDRETADDLRLRYLAAIEEEREAERKVKAIEGEIKDRLGHHEHLTVEGSGLILFSWNASIRYVLDQTRLRQEKPEIASAYRKPQVGRTFRQHITTRRGKYMARGALMPF
jgi:hypothetical protein